jgi:hypothetical protein
MNRLITGKTGIKTAAATFALLFALGQTGVYAATATTTIVDSKIISSTKHVENFYNAFGACFTSTEDSKTVTSSTKVDENGKESSSETVTESSVVQTWKGGSLKVDSSTSESTTEGTDGSSSKTTSTVSYTYDSAGRLSAASGTAKTTGTLAEDAKGGSGGEYSSNQTTSYIIKNAQALPSQTVTKTTTTLEGQEKSTSTETTDFTYELIGGAWHLTKEVSNSSTSMTDGGSEQRTTIKTYTRDANGVCTKVEQSCTGTSKSISETAGTTEYTMENYDAVFAFDEQNGFYLSKESYDWVLNGS